MPQVQKKIPERRCVGCGNPFPKKDLVRVVKTPDGSIELDFTGKKAGRGAYVCRNIDCLIKARKAKRLERSLNTSIPEDVSAALEAELKQYAAKE